MLVNWRRLIAPGIAAFVTFWLLIALGVWQLHRLKWKEGILAAIHQARDFRADSAARTSHPVRESLHRRQLDSGQGRAVWRRGA